MTGADAAHRQDVTIGQVVRTQEEIGTGGGGFRFHLSASFPQEAADSCLGRPALGGPAWNNRSTSAMNGVNSAAGHGAH